MKYFIVKNNIDFEILDEEEMQDIYNLYPHVNETLLLEYNSLDLDEEFSIERLPYDKHSMLHGNNHKCIGYVKVAKELLVKVEDILNGNVDYMEFNSAKVKFPLDKNSTVICTHTDTKKIDLISSYVIICKSCGLDLGKVQ